MGMCVISSKLALVTISSNWFLWPIYSSANDAQCFVCSSKNICALS